jgi:hypothetical protein
MLNTFAESEGTSRPVEVFDFAKRPKAWCFQFDLVAI